MKPRLILVDGSAVTNKEQATKEIAAALSAAGETVKTFLCHADTSAPSYVQMMQPVLDSESWVVICSTWRADDVRESLGHPTLIPWQLRRMLNRLALGCSAHLALCRWPARAIDADEEHQQMINRITDAWASAPTSGIPLTHIASAFHLHLDIELMLERMDKYIDKTINQGPGVGAWRPGRVVLLVGDRHGPSLQPYQVKANIAFCDMAKAGSSFWLTTQLAQRNIPEESLYWINGFDAAGAPTDSSFVERLKPITILAMGDNAARWARSCGLRYEQYSHPQYHKRFRSKEPYPLIDRIAEAIG